MGKNLGTEDIFRKWEEQEIPEVEKEQLDKWAKDIESCPQVKRGKNFQEKWAVILNIKESQGETMKSIPPSSSLGPERLGWGFIGFS